MGLHVNIDAVKRDNDAKDGYRKQGCIVRQGDKMTREEKDRLIKENRKKYGLPRKYLSQLTLPTANKIRVYEIDRILNSRSKLSTADKILHLKAIYKNLARKLSILNRGGQITTWKFVSPDEWLEE